MFENDMKSAKDLLKLVAASAPRIIIGNSTYFRDTDKTVVAYSSDMNVNELTHAILFGWLYRFIAVLIGMITWIFM